jgi:hypothetical protein
MAIIPVAQKFHTLSSTVDTVDRGSAELQSQREIYTMQDIIDSIPAGSSTDLKNATVTLTPAQLLTLNGGGTLSLIPAPGAGKLIAVMNVVYKLDFTSVQYNFAGALGQSIQFYIGTDPSRGIGFNIFNAAVDQYGSLDFPNSDTNTDIQPNVAFTLQASSGVSVSQGDSPFVINILYREVTI